MHKNFAPADWAPCKTTLHLSINLRPLEIMEQKVPMMTIAINSSATKFNVMCQL